MNKIKFNVLDDGFNEFKGMTFSYPQMYRFAEFVGIMTGCDKVILEQEFPDGSTSNTVIDVLKEDEKVEDNISVD